MHRFSVFCLLKGVKLTLCSFFLIYKNLVAIKHKYFMCGYKVTNQEEHDALDSPIYIQLLKFNPEYEKDLNILSQWKVVNVKEEYTACMKFNLQLTQLLVPENQHERLIIIECRRMGLSRVTKPTRKTNYYRMSPYGTFQGNKTNTKD